MTEHTTQWNAQDYRDRHAFVYESSVDLVEQWLRPSPGERILDLGCGTGELSAHIAGSGAQVTGIDAAPDMILGARARHPGPEFAVQDAHTMTFARPFDAVFSNAALHWMSPLDQVFDQVHRALIPGGRLALEMGGAGNVQVTLDAAQQATQHLGLPELTPPWVFPSTAELTRLLEDAGFRVRRTQWFERPSRLVGADGFRAWLQSFGSGWLAPLAPEARAEVIRHAEAYARPFLWDGQDWRSDYCRLRALAERTDR